VRVAIGDVDGDGSNDLIVAQGNFGQKVNVYRDGDPTQLIHTGTQNYSFKVGKGNYIGGVNLSVGDIDHDGRQEIFAGHNRLSAPTVEIWDYQSLLTLSDAAGFVQKATFNAFPASYQQGVRVAIADVNLDGNMDIITAVGWMGKSKVNIFDGSIFAGRSFR